MNRLNLKTMPGLQSERRVRTLLVDDSPLMRVFLARLMEENGFEVVGTAADGREALLYVAALKPDLVLMDVEMPYLDGLEATLSIKESGGRGGYAPVIVMVTSEDTLACRSRAEEVGADGFVPKSGNLRTELNSTLEKLFGRNGESLPAEPVEAGHESSCV
jgi:DNA-binding NarL/FixJ family response regulator